MGRVARTNWLWMLADPHKYFNSSGATMQIDSAENPPPGA